MDDAGLDGGLRPHVRHDGGQAFQPVADQEEHVPHAPVFHVQQHRHPELGAFPAGPRPQPQDVFAAVQGHPDRGVDRPVGDLTVADLHHDRVDEDRRVDLVQRPVLPRLHLLDHLVGDPADGLLRHRGAVDLREVRADLTRGQTLRIQRQDDLIDPGQPPLPLLDDLRLERPGPVPRHVDPDWAAAAGQHLLGPGPVADVPAARALACGIMLLITQVAGHLLVQRGLDHGLGQLLQQPVRASQRQAPLAGQPHQLPRSLSFSGYLSGLLLGGHAVQCRGHHGTSPARPAGLA